MWRRNFESLNLVKALNVQTSAWLSARVAPLPQLVSPARYWVELRDDVVILYPASQVLLQYRLTNAKRSEYRLPRMSNASASLTAILEAMPQPDISRLAQRVSSNHVHIYVLHTTKITRKKDDSCMILKSRRNRAGARLLFDTPEDMQEWQESIAQALSRDRKHLSDFEVVRHVGKGASGRVYEVEEKETGERLALKVIEKATVFESEDTYRHAMDERIVLQMIRKHPFILDMRYAFQNAKRLFIVTEFCGGGDLFEYMNRKVAPLDESTAKFVAAEILLALEHLHNLGVVYRDLKLENILIDDDGHIRLADFGLTKVLRQDDGSLQRTSTFCGTREYVAPEMLRGEPYDCTIDFWTFGILLYEMLSGRTPFYTSDHSEIYKRIEKAPVFYPRNLSAEVRSLLAKLLQREPSKRLGAGKGGLNAIKDHEWFKSLNWDAVMQKTGSESPLKKTIRFLSRQEEKREASANNSARKSKKQQQQEKALAMLLADIKEDMKYVSSLPSHLPAGILSTRPRSPMEKRGERILAGYTFCDPSRNSRFGSSPALVLHSGTGSSFVSETRSLLQETRDSETTGESIDIVEKRRTAVNSQDNSRRSGLHPEQGKASTYSPISIRDGADGGQQSRVSLQ